MNDLSHVNIHKLILAALQDQDKPLPIKEIAERAGLNRHKVARNLDALEILGRVRKIEIGNAKKYYLVKAIPVSSLIDISVDLILIIDSGYHIQYLNHSAQHFLGIHDRPVVGERLDLLNLDLFSSPKVLNGLKHFTPEKVFRIDIEYPQGEKIQWYSLSIMAISLNPGTYSIALIAEDVSGRKEIESALISSENKFRSIFSAEADAIFLCDQRNGFILEANPAACETYGYRYDEILNLKFTDLSAHEEMDTHLQNEIDGSPSYVYHKRKDNSVFPVDIRTSSFAIDEYQGTIIAVRDVTDRKKMEDDIRESEAFATSIFNSVTYSICILDKKGTIISVNQRWKDFAHDDPLRDKGHYITWNYLEVCDAAIGPGSEQAHRFAAGIRAVINGDIPEYSQDYGGEETDERRYFMGRVSRLNSSKTGLLRIIITHEDITRTRMAYLAHQESERRLREVLEYSSDVSYRKNCITDQYDYLSPSIEQISGFSPEEFLSLPVGTVFSRIHPDDRTRIETVITDAMSRMKGAYEIEYRFKHKDGHYVWFEDYFSVITESDNRQFRVGRVRDITEKKRVQEELTRVQQDTLFLSELLENSSIPFGITDPKGSVIYCNDAFLALTGYSREEILSLNVFEDLNVSQWKEDMRGFHEKITGGVSSLKIEKEYIRKDGSRIPVEIAVHVKRRPDGEVELYYGFASDITQRKLTEQWNLETRKHLEELVRERTLHLEQQIEARKTTEVTLQESEARFHTIFYYSPSAIVVYDPDTDLFVDVNPAAERLYECDRSTLLSTNPKHFFLPIPSYLYIEKTFHDNVIKTLEGEEVVTERTIRDAFGIYKYCIIQLVRIMYLGKFHIRASFIDITKRRALEEALTRSNRYNRSLIEASIDPLVTIGTDGRITDVNLATEQVTGYSRHDLIGSDFSTYFSDPRKAKSGYLQVFQNSQIRDFSLEIRHRDGHCTPVLYNASVFRDEEGNIAGVLAAARDVTEQIRRDEIFHDTEDRFVTFFEHSPIGMAIVSPSGRCMKVNPAFCTMIGYSAEELSILPFTAYTHPDDRNEDLKQFEAVNAGFMDSYVMEKKYIRKDGRVIRVQLNVSSVRDKNGFLNYCISQILEIPGREGTDDRNGA